MNGYFALLKPFFEILFQSKNGAKKKKGLNSIESQGQSFEPCSNQYYGTTGYLWPGGP